MIQHDDDMDEWGSEYELQRWSRAASWKPAGTNSIIRYTSAMIYAIAVMDICDFEAIGRKMPKGTGVDATVDNGAVVPKHKRKRRVTNVASDPGGILKVLELGDAQDARMSALRMLLEFGTTSEKHKAKKELHKIAFPKSNATSAINNDNDNNLETSCDDDSATCLN